MSGAGLPCVLRSTAVCVVRSRARVSAIEILLLWLQLRVGDELAVDDVGELSLQAPEGFSRSCRRRACGGGAAFAAMA